MSKPIRIGKAAEQLNISASSLRKYANQGRIDFLLTPDGQRVFTQEALDNFLGIEQEQTLVFYTRSSNGNKTLLETQKTLLTEAYGAPIKVYSDNASGLSEKRPGLTKLLNDAKKGNFTTVCITEKDRLTRFGFTYLETLLNNLNIQICVLGETEHKTLHEELLQDFMSLLASFSGKFYRLRGYEQKKLLLNKAGEYLEENRQ